MIDRTASRYPMMLVLAAGMAATAASPVRADFFRDVERAFVGTFTGAYEDARDGAKGLARDASRAINGPVSDEPVTYVPGTTSGSTVYAPPSGSLVADVQGELTRAGYDPGPADGINGPRTARAVRAYQAANALPQDGQATQALLDHMRSSRTAAYNAGPPPAPVVPPPSAMQPDLPQLPGTAVQPQPQQGLRLQTQQGCKPYERRTRIDGRETVTTGTACLQADGTWKPIN